MVVFQGFVVLALQHPRGPGTWHTTTQKRKLSEFLANGCGCAKKCYKFFDTEHYQDIRDQCAELSKDELDLVLLGQIMANINIATVVGPQSKHTPTGRKRPRLSYSHQGRSICKVTFLILHGVGKFPHYQTTTIIHNNFLYRKRQICCIMSALSCHWADH